MGAREEQELDEATAKWIDEQEKLMEEGKELVRLASDEALEYVQDAVENLNDVQWRKMSMESQAVEMGIGVGMAEYLVPNVYNAMKKNLHKQVKVERGTAEALRHIYIGRVIKNIRKKLNERNQ